MLQRIQSVFLGLAAVASALTWLFPVRVWRMGDSAVTMGTSRLVNGEGMPIADAALPIPYSVLHTVVAVVMVVAIFLYRDRLRQARVVRGGWLVALLAAGLQFISCNSADAYFGGAEGRYGLSFGLPLVVVVLGILAERAIRRDEALVRSADRLR